MHELAALDATRPLEEYLPNCDTLTRDILHRGRSVLKGTWKKFPRRVQETLDELVSGESSFATMIETSRKYSQLWEQAQLEMTAVQFCRLLRNMSYAKQRVDSHYKPLFRIFKMFPVAVRTLVLLMESGDDKDKAWAVKLLQRWSGPDAFKRLLCTAVAADIMMLCRPFLRLHDSATDDASVTASACAELLHDAKILLFDGAIFLPEASNSLLVHCFLETSKSFSMFRKE